MKWTLSLFGLFLLTLALLTEGDREWPPFVSPAVAAAPSARATPPTRVASPAARRPPASHVDITGDWLARHPSGQLNLALSITRVESNGRFYGTWSLTGAGEAAGTLIGQPGSFVLFDGASLIAGSFTGRMERDVMVGTLWPAYVGQDAVSLTFRRIE